MKRLFLILLIMGFIAGLLCLPANAQTPDQLPRKIVVFDETIVNEPAQIALVRKFGGVVIKPLQIINGLAVYLPSQAIEAVLKERGVLRIDNDVIVYAIAKPQPPQPAEVLPWGVDKIEADLAWTVTSGLAVKVGIVDTGIDLAHPDLLANIKGNVNTITPLKSGNDDNGHGTHVAGIVAAVDNTTGVIGVGPEIYLYAVKVLGKNGSGWLSDIIEGIQWCVNNGIQVVNMSLGTYSEIQSLHDAVTAAYNGGLIMVAAAGNEGVSTPLYPAAYDEVIAVAASDINNQIPIWSNWGPYIDLTAPGVNIYSTYKGSSYKALSGTSMATPHVVGTAALVLRTSVGTNDLAIDPLHPDTAVMRSGVWDPAEVKNKLQAKAQNLGYNNYQQGAGLVRADLAIQ